MRVVKIVKILIILVMRIRLFMGAIRRLEILGRKEMERVSNHVTIRLRRI
jgi:hypothetical protein